MHVEVIIFSLYGRAACNEVPQDKHQTALVEACQSVFRSLYIQVACS